MNNKFRISKRNIEYENRKIICDYCGEEIPKVKKKDVFGIEREYYRMGKLNYGEPFTDINCQNLGLDLCKRCAGRISLEMYQRRMELINSAQMMKERRKKYVQTKSAFEKN